VSLTSKRGLRAVTAATALALLAGSLAFAGGADARPDPAGQQPIKLDLLAINDFHGQLEKLDAAKTSSGRINSTPAGGAEYLATHLDQLRAAAHARGARTITVAAGDLIGATPLLSAAFHDEPTVEAMNGLGLQIASVGNHEFDEGYRELLRMQNGGCLDDGNGANNQNSCPDADHPFTGADYQYLSANVKYTDSGKTVFPGYVVEKVGRAKVGFIGMTLEDTPNIVTKSGVEGLTFTDEVQTANALVPELRAQGVRSIVVLLHQGGAPSDPTKYDECAGVTGPGVDIAEQLDPAFDVVVTGHTHQAYNCTVQDPAGHPRLLTSASSLGRLVTDVSLEIDPRTKDIIRPTATAENHIVTNSDGTAARGDITDLIARYQQLVAPIAGKVLGQIAPAESTDSLTRTADPDGGDSPLGNLIVDSQLADESTVPSGGTTPVIALMNPGGIRNDLVEDASGNVTYSAAFAVQPFNNYVVSETLTGQQLLDVLNQQWNGKNEGVKNNKILQVAGLSYTWDKSDADLQNTDALVPGSVKLDLDRDGTAETPLDPAARYRVVVNSFLSDGGDGFSTLGQGTDKYFGGLDIDALADYLAGHDPYTPAPTTRISSVS
jgi:5'-nucleotidase